MSNHYVCINCGFKASNLYKKYSNVIKTVNCDKCLKVVDKYVEFEPIIILVDCILLSPQVYRHTLYNRNFKLFWKLSLVLLLLESFAQWRETKENSNFTDILAIHEQGFYICCFQYIIDNVITTTLLFATAVPFRYHQIRTNWRFFYVTLLKANTLGNLSKFFLLPVILWRDNTTKDGADLHRILVKIHHLSSQILAYMIASDFKMLLAAFIVLSLNFFKDHLLHHLANVFEIPITLI